MSERKLGEYMHAKIVKKNEKTDVWAILSSHHDGVALGIVKWNASWRQYCFFPSDETVFSSGCMVEIVGFVDSLNKSRKKSLASKVL